MSKGKYEQARCKYAQDLRTLRERRGVSLETVYAETRIIKSVLNDYEKNCLYNNSNFHRIYLRSLTRAYAKVVDLDVDQVLNALEMALDGTYDGRLDPNHQEPEEPSVKVPAKKSANTRAPRRGASSSKKDKTTDGG